MSAIHYIVFILVLWIRAVSQSGLEDKLFEMSWLGYARVPESLGQGTLRFFIKFLDGSAYALKVTNSKEGRETITLDGNKIATHFKCLPLFQAYDYTLTSWKLAQLDGDFQFQLFDKTGNSSMECSADTGVKDLKLSCRDTTKSSTCKPIYLYTWSLCKPVATGVTVEITATAKNKVLSNTLTFKVSPSDEEGKIFYGVYSKSKQETPSQIETIECEVTIGYESVCIQKFEFTVALHTYVISKLTCKQGQKTKSDNSKHGCTLYHKLSVATSRCVLCKYQEWGAGCTQSCWQCMAGCDKDTGNCLYNRCKYFKKSGLNCDIECEDKFFNPNALQVKKCPVRCQCRDDAPCRGTDGLCRKGCGLSRYSSNRTMYCTAVCPRGWFGHNCSLRCHCKTEPKECYSNGECKDQICEENYRGMACTRIINYCLLDPNPCQNEGTCTFISPGKYECKCAGDWFGLNCTKNDVNRCLPVPNICRNGGECRYILAGVYDCICKGDWYGTNCTDSDALSTKAPRTRRPRPKPITRRPTVATSTTTTSVIPVVIPTETASQAADEGTSTSTIVAAVFSSLVALALLIFLTHFFLVKRHQQNDLIINIETDGQFADGQFADDGSDLHPLDFSSDYHPDDISPRASRSRSAYSTYSDTDSRRYSDMSDRRSDISTGQNNDMPIVLFKRRVKKSTSSHSVSSKKRRNEDNSVTGVTDYDRTQSRRRRKSSSKSERGGRKKSRNDDNSEMTEMTDKSRDDRTERKRRKRRDDDTDKSEMTTRKSKRKKKEKEDDSELSVSVTKSVTSTKRRSKSKRKKKRDDEEKSVKE